MRRTSSTTSAGLIIGMIGLVGLIAAGCRDQPPPPQVPVPTAYNRDVPITRSDDGMKPLPQQRPIDQGPIYAPYDDVPLISQQPPEQPAFVEAYRQVGAPRIVLFVNRTLEGNIVAVNPNDPVLTVEQRRRSPEGARQRTTEVYLHPGQYDEAQAKSIDYEAVENIMTDWLACNGQVTIISPIMARDRLSDEQVKELQEGRPQAMSEVVRQLGADIFVQVQAKPTRQTFRGLEVRIIAEAINIKGGESIARAVVDVPPPLEKTQINTYTRFLARKLMDGMLGTWSAPPPPPAGAAPNAVPNAVPPPTTRP